MISLTARGITSLDQGRNFGHGLLLSRLSCRNYGPICMEHPLFFGSLCNRECKNKLLQTSYSIGEDDIHVSCAICGVEEVVVCENGSFSSCWLARD
ncbi:DNA (cytosine-5)-methyltransferase 3A-like [Daphnia pulex]|uniref:DNA (cytosine-5)-methyltransferase 3A-like n=1 Tax=Daphnia pulex TaxID=6669 RepID=UPI001EDE5149|nr:DNA (cytosine-5)-methyltransferase 3A-like [Daphnia pulex]